MSYEQGTTVKLTRDKGEMIPPALAGAVCIIHRNEGFGCYILRGPIADPETESRLFAALEDEFQAVTVEATI